MHNVHTITVRPLVYADFDIHRIQCNKLKQGNVKIMFYSTHCDTSKSFLLYTCRMCYTKNMLGPLNCLLEKYKKI